jgi:hypothetical protein
MNLPNWLINIIDDPKLPWGKNVLGLKKKWNKRFLTDIKGVCFHQSAGNKSPYKINNYHINPNHISPKGCPHICYTIVIDDKVYLCNNLDDIVWSQGTGKQPGDENKYMLSVVIGGLYKSKYAPSALSPTKYQMDCIGEVWNWAKKEFNLTDGDIFGHFDFGKASCPGDDIEKFIKDVRSKEEVLLNTVEDWQKALIDLGYYHEIIDGCWGYLSRKALVKFQKDHFVGSNGCFDRPTAWLLRKLLTKKNS